MDGSTKYFLLNILKRPEAQVSIALIAVMLVLTLTVYKDVPVFQERWIPCLEDLGKGELYQGQPRCVQGPVFFLATFIMQKIFGIFFDSAVIITSIILHIIMFFLIIALAKKSIPKFSLWLVGLLYILLVFIPTSNHLASFYSGIFFLIGFSLLFFIKLKRRLFFAGISFGISLLNNANSIIPIIFSILIWLIHRIKWKDKPPNSLIEKSSPLVFILSPILALIVIFELILPGALSHQFFVLGLHEQGSFISSLSQFFNYLTTPITNQEIKVFLTGILGFTSSISPIWMISFVTIIIGLLAFLLNKKNPITQLFLISTITMTYLNIKFGGGDPIRHFLPLNFLLVISIVLVYSKAKEEKTHLTSQIKKQEEKPWKKIISTSALVLSLTMAFAYYNHTPHADKEQIEQFVKEIAYPLSSTLPLNYTILTDTDLSPLAILNKNQTIFPKIIPEKGLDETQALRLEYLNLLKEPWSDWQNKNYEDYLKIIENLLKQNYDAIVMANPPHVSPVFNLLQSINRSINKELTTASYDILELANLQCQVKLFIVTDPCLTCWHSLILYLKDDKICQQVEIQKALYYYKNFYNLCEKDAVLLNYHAINSNLPPQYRCTTSKSILMESFGDGFIISYNQMIIFILLLIVIIIYVWRQG